MKVFKKKQLVIFSLPTDIIQLPLLPVTHMHTHTRAQ